MKRWGRVSGCQGRLGRRRRGAAAAAAARLAGRGPLQAGDRRGGGGRGAGLEEGPHPPRADVAPLRRPLVRAAGEPARLVVRDQDDLREVVAGHEVALFSVREVLGGRDHHLLEARLLRRLQQVLHGLPVQVAALARVDEEERLLDVQQRCEHLELLALGAHLGNPFYFVSALSATSCPVPALEPAREHCAKW